MIGILCLNIKKLRQETIKDYTFELEISFNQEFTEMRASQVALVKNPPANAGDSGDAGSVLGLRRSPGEGNGNLLQYS